MNRRDIFKGLIGTICAPVVTKLESVVPIKYHKYIFPNIVKVKITSILKDLIGVYPMGDPSGFINYAKLVSTDPKLNRIQRWKKWWNG
jgi:hypothetical protein